MITSNSCRGTYPWAIELHLICPLLQFACLWGGAVYRPLTEDDVPSPEDIKNMSTI